MQPHILILAAGQGKRMHSSLPKVLHPVLFQPMLHHVVDLAKSLPHSSISVIVGHGEAEVKAACSEYSDVQFFRQEKQRGTADAVSAAKGFLQKQKGQVLILSGDVCLLKKESIEAFLAHTAKEKSALSFITTQLENPTGYGRVLRGAQKKVTGIREEADASAKEKKISEINAGIYCAEITLLLETLAQIEPKNQQGEFYLTDAIGLLVKKKKKVTGFCFSDCQETLGVNDRAGLAEAERVLQSRINAGHLSRGVTIHLPDTVLIDARTTIAPDAEIGSGSQLSHCQIAAGVVIDAHCSLHGCKISAKAHIKQGSVLEDSQVGPESTVGPYAHLRPESVLGARVKVGNFVEIKKSTFKEGAKASHLSYIGDAEIGKNSNLGCGFITCNYDGKKKHRTVIKDDVFVGSDTQVVAPIEIGEGSYIASGSTLTQNVPKDSMVISRGKQVTKVGYAKKYRNL